MRSKKITEAEIADLKVAALPTRPNAATRYGGGGYSAADVKAAFDRLPLYIIEKYNLLIDDILGESNESISDAIKTNFTPTHTLANMLSDIPSGDFAYYLRVGDGYLNSVISELKEKLDAVIAHLGLSL